MRSPGQQRTARPECDLFMRKSRNADAWTRTAWVPIGSGTGFAPGGSISNRNTGDRRSALSFRVEVWSLAENADENGDSGRAGGAGRIGLSK